MLKDVETKAFEAALNVLLDRVVEGLHNRRFWQWPRTSQIVRAVGAKLDDLILDLQPCFALNEQTSLLQVLYQSSPTRNGSYNRLFETMNVLAAWFRAWNDSRQAIGDRRTPEILVNQLQSLIVILNYLGFYVSEGLRKRFEGAPDYALVTYRAMTERYNRFLTDYEGLLRRLPQDVGIESPLGGQHFFIRL
jgi:hypothetical protein